MNMVVCEGGFCEHKHLGAWWLSSGLCSQKPPGAGPGKLRRLRLVLEFCFLNSVASITVENIFCLLVKHR